MSSSDSDPTTTTVTGIDAEAGALVQAPRAALEAAFAAGEAARAAEDALAAAEAEFASIAARAAVSGAFSRPGEAQGSDAPAQAEAAPLTTAPDAARALDAVLRDLRGDARASEQQLEALLFSTHIPLTIAEIAAALHITPEQTLASLQRLEAAIAERPSAVALFLREKAGQRAFILDLKTAYRQDAATVAPPMLKPVVTETLALIAMNQPLSQSRLVRERGTGVYDHVKELLQRGLVQRRREGRNYLLRTTDAFAAEFGLDNDPELIRRALARAAGVQGTPEVVGSNRINWAALDPARPQTDLVAEARAHVPPPPPPPAPAASEAFEADTPTSVREDCVVSGGDAAVETVDVETVEAAPIAEVAPIEAPAEAEAPKRKRKKRDAVASEAPPADAAPIEAPPIEAPPIEVATFTPAVTTNEVVAPFPEEIPVSTQPKEQIEKRETSREPEVVDPKAANLLAMFQDQATSDDW